MVESQLLQVKVISSTNGLCGSRFESSLPANSPNSLSESTQISCLFSQRQIGSGVPQ